MLCLYVRCATMFLHPVLRVTEMALPRQHSRPRFHEMQSRDLELEDPVGEFVALHQALRERVSTQDPMFLFFSCPNVLVFIVRCPSCWLVRRVGCKFLGTFDISWCWIKPYQVSPSAWA